MPPIKCGVTIYSEVKQVRVNNETLIFFWIGDFVDCVIQGSQGAASSTGPITAAAGIISARFAQEMLQNKLLLLITIALVLIIYPDGSLIFMQWF